MTSLKTLHLLACAAQNYRQQKETFSKEQINHKIQEIKYLTDKKKIPRFFLRKEIIHLENQLNGILNVEKAINCQKKQESLKVASLKRQISTLQKRLNACEDKELQKKIDRLSHFLGELLAKKKSEEEIRLSRQMLKIIKDSNFISKTENEFTKRDVTIIEETENIPESFGVQTSETVSNIITDEPKISDEEFRKLNYIYHRLDMLKTELKIHRGLEKDEKKIKEIELKIEEIEKKIEDFSKDKLTCKIDNNLKNEVKHDILFNIPPSSSHVEGINEEELEKELPLPPPPRLVK